MLFLHDNSPLGKSVGPKSLPYLLWGKFPSFRAVSLSTLGDCRSVCQGIGVSPLPFISPLHLPGQPQFFMSCIQRWFLCVSIKLYFLNVLVSGWWVSLPQSPLGLPCRRSHFLFQKLICFGSLDKFLSSMSGFWWAGFVCLLFSNNSYAFVFFDGAFSMPFPLPLLRHPF